MLAVALATRWVDRAIKRTASGTTSAAFSPRDECLARAIDQRVATIALLQDGRVRDATDNYWWSEHEHHRTRRQQV